MTPESIETPTELQLSVTEVWLEALARGTCDEAGGVPNLLDGRAQENTHPSIPAFGFEHA